MKLHIICLVVVPYITSLNVALVAAQGDDFFRLMMLSSLFNGGGFGGGGGGFGGSNGGFGTGGFEVDPTLNGRTTGSGNGAGGSGGLFGGLMALLSRGTSAPLLLDIDGDVRQQLWQRALNVPGTHGEGKANNVNIIDGIGGTHSGRHPSPRKQKSMPHVALPYDTEYSGSGAGQPAQLESRLPVQGVAADKQIATGIAARQLNHAVRTL